MLKYFSGKIIRFYSKQYKYIEHFDMPFEA